MVLLDEGVKDNSKVLVGVPVSGVDAAVLVVKLNRDSNGLVEGEARGLGLNILELLPFVLGDMLGDQGVGGSDDGEVAGGDIVGRVAARGADRLRLEGADHLQGVVNDLVDGEGAGDHVPGSTTVVNDDKGLPGDTLLSVEDSVLLGDLARPVRQQGNVTLALQAAIGPARICERTITSLFLSTIGIHWGVGGSRQEVWERCIPPNTPPYL